MRQYNFEVHKYEDWLCRQSSTLEQNAALQEDALHQSVCGNVITDKINGSIVLRPGLEKVKELLRFEDTLIVWRLDRLGGSLKDLITWASYLEEKSIGLISLQETIDTTTSTGELLFYIFEVLAEFECNLIRERTMAGLAAAIVRGKKDGRPKSLDKKIRGSSEAL